MSSFEGIATTSYVPPQERLHVPAFEDRLVVNKHHLDNVLWEFEESIRKERSIKELGPWAAAELGLVSAVVAGEFHDVFHINDTTWAIGFAGGMIYCGIEICKSFGRLFRDSKRPKKTRTDVVQDIMKEMRTTGGGLILSDESAPHTKES